MTQKERQIAGTELFGGCTPAELRWVAKTGDLVDLPAGAYLARRGRSVRELVLVLGGRARGVGPEGEIVLGPGSLIGAGGLLDGRPHRMTVEALEPVSVLVLESRAFHGMLQRVPSVARKLLVDFASRMTVTDLVAS